MRRTVVLFGGLALALLVLYQLDRYALIRGNVRTEVLVGATALAFLGLGLLLRRREPVKAIPTSPAETVPAVTPGQRLTELGITPREFEVLQQVAAGRSNREIGEALFLSESTVKTHVSNLLAKLDARRRTQAVVRARELGVLGSPPKVSTKEGGERY